MGRTADSMMPWLSAVSGKTLHRYGAKPVSYTHLDVYKRQEQTRHLRHDFRQHLLVIAGLTEAGQVDELKNYLHQYESELSEERPRCV